MRQWLMMSSTVCWALPHSHVCDAACVHQMSALSVSALSALSVQNIVASRKMKSGRFGAWFRDTVLDSPLSRPLLFLVMLVLWRETAAAEKGHREGTRCGGSGLRVPWGKMPPRMSNIIRAYYMFRCFGWMSAMLLPRTDSAQKHMRTKQTVQKNPSF